MSTAAQGIREFSFAVPAAESAAPESRVQTVLLVTLTALMPVLHKIGVPGEQVNICAADLVFALAAPWLLRRFLVRGIRIPLLPVFAWFVSAMCLSMLVNAETTFQYRSPLDAGISLIKALVPWGYFFLVANLVSSRRHLLLLVRTWLIASVFVAASGIYGAMVFQMYGIETRFALDYRAFGTMGDPNFYSMHLGVSLLLAILYWRLVPHRPWWTLPVMAIALTGMVLSASRSGLLGLCAAGAMLFLVAVSARLKFAAVVGVAGLGCLLAVVPGTRPLLTKNPFTERLATTTVNVRETDRSALWARALREFLSSPVVGVGYENGPYAEREHLGMTQEAHNTYLGLLAETGVLGFAGFIVAFTYFPIRILRDALGRPRQLRLTAWYVAAPFVLVGTVAMALNAENYRGMWMLMGAACCFHGLYVAGKQPKPENEIAP